MPTERVRVHLSDTLEQPFADLALALLAEADHALVAEAHHAHPFFD